MTNEEKFHFVIRYFEIIDGVLWPKPYISHAGWNCKAKPMTTNANHPDGYCSSEQEAHEAYLAAVGTLRYA